MSRVLESLTELQVRRPSVILLAAALLSLGSIGLIRNLGLDSRFIALLPEEAPSVRDLEAVQDRVRGLSTMTIAVESPSKDIKAMRAFVDDLVKHLEAMPPEKVGLIDWNVGAYKDFVRENRHQYASLDVLERLRDAMEIRLDEERLKHNPFYVSLMEPGEVESVEDVLDELEATEKEAEEDSERFPDGYYQAKEGDLIAVFSRSDVAGDVGGTGALVSRFQKIVDDLNPKSYGDLEVSFSGDVIIAKEEQQAIARELIVATSLTVGIVLFLIILFFGRLRSVFLLGAGLLPPTLMSFAIAELTVDALNTSTAFLGSIIIGNGVNPNIIWLSRYFEERRRGQAVDKAILTTHQGVWLATMIASGAAALAYGSLLVTDFRGFRDFGIIGGAGMTLCWVSAMVVLPAAVAAYERVRPLPPAKSKRTRGGGFANLFAYTAEHFPKAVLVASALASVIAVGAVAYAAWHDPIEYDFRNLRSMREEGSSEARRINGRVNQIIDSSQQGRGIVVLVSSRDEIPVIEAQLDKSKGATHGGYRSLEDLLPKDVETKREILEEIRELSLDLYEYANDETRKKIDDNIPPENLPKLAIDDLPLEVALRFMERDGTRGRLLVVKEAEERSIWDGRYLVEWAGELRTLKETNGARPPLAGRATIFADVIESVYDDMPKAITAALLATMTLVLFSFRKRSHSLLSIMALLFGILWMAGTMALLGMKLNFLNFVAFPITFGNGADYSINVMRRYRLEQKAGNPDAIGSAVRLSGGAVVLCSLTTIVGYSSLYVSANLAMNSFGLAMAISEVTCLLAAVLTLPAVIILFKRRQPK